MGKANLLLSLHYPSQYMLFKTCTPKGNINKEKNQIRFPSLILYKKNNFIILPLCRANWECAASLLPFMTFEQWPPHDWTDLCTSASNKDALSIVVLHKFNQNQAQEIIFWFGAPCVVPFSFANSVIRVYYVSFFFYLTMHMYKLICVRKVIFNSVVRLNKGWLSHIHLRFIERDWIHWDYCWNICLN